MQIVFFSQTLKANQKLQKYFSESNKNFRDAGF